MTLTEWQAQQIETAAKLMAHFVRQTPPERLHWKPVAEAPHEGRSVVDQVQECARANRIMCAALKGEAAPEMGEPITEVEPLIEELMASAAAHAAAIRAFDPARLDAMCSTPHGEMPAAFCIGMPALHMNYHTGQICYVQTLYGDREFRPSFD